MSEFKGTQGKLERKYVSGVCFGIGTFGNYSQITANSILPDSDEQYKKEKTEIEANMLLYSKSPEMLEMLEHLTKVNPAHEGYHALKLKAINLIKEATTL